MTRRPDDGEPGELACVVLAHADPGHVRRLVRALDPFPVVLHCDARTPAGVHRAMVEGLPDRVRLLPRRATGWATWGLVDAELAGYRAALATTRAAHVALLTGSDYPLAPAPRIADELARLPGRSVARYHPLPYEYWGRSGGLARLRYPHWARGKRMVRVPVPRRLPADVRPWGGSQLKVLARRHVAALLAAVDARPDLVRFWRRAWVPDESFVASLLNAPHLVPGWAGEHLDASFWYIAWDGSRRKSPPCFRLADLEQLVAARHTPQDGVPRLFARKFSSGVDTAVLDALDRSLLARPAG